MGTSTNINNELTSGTVQTISMDGYNMELNGEMSNGAISLNNSIVLPSNNTRQFSFTSLNSYPQPLMSDFGGGGTIL